MTERLAGKVIPEHIATILDGNGRWATEWSPPRAMGHKAGCEAAEQTVRDCVALGVKHLTVCGFSTENWKCSEEEVGALMHLFRLYLKKLLKVAKEEGCRCKMTDDKSRFAPDVVAAIDRLVEETRGDTGMTFVIAINCGGRDELRCASLCLLDAKRASGDTSLTEEEISNSLDAAGIPDSDLLIRMSGEPRLSNFLLWQLAYGELYATLLYWPDFTMEALEDAILVYNQGECHFGGCIS